MTRSIDRASRPRTVHVEHCMGTVFTIDIRDQGRWNDAVADVVAWLHQVDAIFSTYKPDSDISRIQRGTLRAENADPDVAVVLDLCAQVQTATGGYFSAIPNGTLDPTGLVKGWALERASEILRGHGSSNHAVNGGGDIQFAGTAAPDRLWRVGIADPQDRTGVVSVLAGRDFAVATSGTAERGQHVVDPFTGRPATGYASATVVGPSLTRADACATAALVMGASSLSWVEDVDGYEVLLVAADRSCTASSGWRRFAAEPQPDASAERGDPSDD